MGYEANRRVETSARTFSIVEHLSRVESAGVSTVADELEMNKGIVHNHLSTLRELGYVRKINDEYQLTPKLLAVGFRRRSKAPLYQFGHDLIDTFAEQFDTGVMLCQRAGTECIVVGARGLSPAMELSVGTVLPLYGSLAGLVLAIRTPDTQAEATEPYDSDAIAESLSDTGYAVDRLSVATATATVAVPVLDDTGACRGSIAVLLPDDLGTQRRQRICEATVSLTERIEDRFATGWTDERSFATEKHAWIG